MLPRRGIDLKVGSTSLLRADFFFCRIFAERRVMPRRRIDPEVVSSSLPRANFFLPSFCVFDCKLQPRHGIDPEVGSSNLPIKRRLFFCRVFTG